MGKIILCNISDVNDIIEEERNCWVFDILDSLGIPEDVFDVSSIDEYRSNINKFGIEVDLGVSGNVNVYKKLWHTGLSDEDSGWLPSTEENLIGQWKEPSRVKKVDGKSVYYELTLNEWSILKSRKT